MKYLTRIILKRSMGCEKLKDIISEYLTNFDDLLKRDALSIRWGSEKIVISSCNPFLMEVLKAFMKRDNRVSILKIISVPIDILYGSGVYYFRAFDVCEYSSLRHEFECARALLDKYFGIECDMGLEVQKMRVIKRANTMSLDGSILANTPCGGLIVQYLTFTGIGKNKFCGKGIVRVGKRREEEKSECI